MMSRDEIVGLLIGFNKNSQEWDKLKNSIENEKEQGDPNHPNTDQWERQLAWLAQWRVSLENQLKHLRRMVIPYAADITKSDQWSIKDLFGIMGETYVTETERNRGSDSSVSSSA